MIERSRGPDDAGFLTGVGVSLSATVRAKVALLRDQAAAGGLVVTCGGVSMQPAIARGDRVAIARRGPRVGDVAAFVTRRGVLELHRLIARAPVGGWWVHAGDNQAARSAFGLVHDAQLVGVADGFARAPGWRDRLRAVERLARAAISFGRKLGSRRRSGPARRA